MTMRTIAGSRPVVDRTWSRYVSVLTSVYVHSSVLSDPALSLTFCRMLRFFWISSDRCGCVRPSGGTAVLLLLLGFVRADGHDAQDNTHFLVHIR